MDIFGGRLNFKKILKTDPVRHDNILFKLHHQANFLIVLFGVVFVFGMNYLNGKAIVCRGDGADEYANQFCWLHGSGHIPNKLASTMNIKCQADQVANSEHNERHTQFYLWIPFVLTLLLALIKAPQIVWEEVCERGFVKKVVEMESGSNMINRFKKLRGKRAKLYTLGYFFCEVLNIGSVMLCFFIMDSLFEGKFKDYGLKVLDYDSTDTNVVDPKCNLFPTLVSCNVQSGGIDGSADKGNTLCLLSNNLFNQYYFLILWWWWEVLLAVSFLGLVCRLAELLSVDVSRKTFMLKRGHLLLLRREHRQVERMDQWDLFLLGKVCQNLKGSQIKELIESFNEEKDNYEEEKRIEKLGEHNFLKQDKTGAPVMTANPGMGWRVESGPTIHSK